MEVEELASLGWKVPAEHPDAVYWAVLMRVWKRVMPREMYAAEVQLINSP